MASIYSEEGNTEHVFILYNKHITEHGSLELARPTEEACLQGVGPALVWEPSTRDCTLISKIPGSDSERGARMSAWPTLCTSRKTGGRGAVLPTRIRLQTTFPRSPRGTWSAFSLACGALVLRRIGSARCAAHDGAGHRVETRTGRGSLWEGLPSSVLQTQPDQGQMLVAVKVWET
ncbi:uncharacterized protein LOC118918132 isoform X1 [Manis pentadactyla]|uniref:uncharacterized protein LOC118918132 isoform X1 n=1 Tax=Manis pentadactyla TaxID=143292 RepID=UPI00255C7AD1|nr:uncharacterized protein LOC118918132 isoform X1 [Manis pentadactyla]XP_057349403.1 uncharacterized protein LOC118918132 isoform X1 [Manis pentadactyla]